MATAGRLQKIYLFCSIGESCTFSWDSLSPSPPHWGLLLKGRICSLGGGGKFFPYRVTTFSTVIRVPLHTAFHYHLPIILIWLKYFWKGRKITSHHHPDLDFLDFWDYFRRKKNTHLSADFHKTNLDRWCPTIFSSSELAQGELLGYRHVRRPSYVWTSVTSETYETYQTSVHQLFSLCTL